LQNKSEQTRSDDDYIIFLYWRAFPKAVLRISYLALSSLLKKILVIGSLMVFSLYIMYDTNNILQRNYSGDFITASLDYYLDIINIFSGLLSGLEFDD
jgi:FtsH-binding integral membrane protein